MQTNHYQGGDRLLFGMVLGVLTFWLFAQSLVNVAPDVQHDLSIPMGSLNLAISLTALFSGCFIVMAGGLADKFGRVRLTYIGFGLSITGSLLLIVANGAVLFTVGRIVQGLSGACVMPATLALIKNYYVGAQRQRALSFWVIGSWGGSGICSLAGGVIATYLGWRWIFIFSIMCALLGMLLIRGTPESKVNEETPSPFDYAGLMMFVLSLVSLNLIITKGSALGWTSMATLGLGLVCVLALIAFVRIELKKKRAGFIDFSLFNNKPYSGAVFSNFMLNAVLGTLLVANMYMQNGRGLTPFQSGLMSIGYVVAVLSMIRVGEKLLQRVGAKKPMLCGPLITGSGVALMTLTFLPDRAYLAAVVVGFVLFGLGLGFYATPSTDTAIANAPLDKIGVASGIYKMASSLGGAFGVAISATVYTAFLPVGVDVAATAGLLVNVGFSLLAFLVICLMVPANAGR